MRTYKLANGVRCKSSVAKRKIPFDMLNAVSVKRPGEKGPTVYYGKIEPKKRYKLDYDCSDGTLRLKKTKKIFRRGRLKNLVAKELCTPLRVPCKWVTGKDQPKDASNIFGGSGFFQVRRKYALTLPLVNALDCQLAMYSKFKCLLVKHGNPLPPLKFDEAIYLVNYQINEQFASKYVHSKDGPGIFIEQHAFPHYLTPVGEDSRNPIVIGKANKDKKNIHLLGVIVPSGYTLYIPGNIVHNDWYFIGDISTSVALDDEADTVFLQGYKTKKIAMEFKRKFKK